PPRSCSPRASPSSSRRCRRACAASSSSPWARRFPWRSLPARPSVLSGCCPERSVDRAAFLAPPRVKDCRWQSAPRAEREVAQTRMETIRGAFVRFLSAPGRSGNDSGLALVRYESSGQMVEAKVGGPFSPMTQPDEWFVAEGEWRENFYRGRGEMLF